MKVLRTPGRTVPSGRVTSTTFGCGTGSASVAAAASRVDAAGPVTSAVGTTFAVRGSSAWNDQRENRLFELNVATRIRHPHPSRPIGRPR